MASLIVVLLFFLVCHYDRNCSTTLVAWSYTAQSLPRTRNAFHQQWISQFQLFATKVEAPTIPNRNPISNSKTIRFVARVGYDGSRYHGWQDQGPTIPTLQNTISAALNKRFGFNEQHSSAFKFVQVSGASRTDQGVHALGQCIHFDVPEDLAYLHLLPGSKTTIKQRSINHVQTALATKHTSRLLMQSIIATRSENDQPWKSSIDTTDVDDNIFAMRGQTPLMRQFQHNWNQILPDDICVYNLSVAPFSKENHSSSVPGLFHSSLSPSGKMYVYRFTLNPYSDIKQRHHTVYFPHHAYFDFPLFEFSLQQFIGTHDFSAFADKLTSSESDNCDVSESDAERSVDPHRTVYSINVVAEKDNFTGKATGFYRVEVHLKTALYRMIRNMVGTCIQVATGMMALKSFLDLLSSTGAVRSDNKAPAAPPEGLCLDNVYYSNY